jgi:ribonuclease HI
LTKLITIYTDGGCHNNVGSWAYLTLDGIPELDDEPTYKMSGLVIGKDATSNRMEMTAIIEAISLHPEGSNLRICSDSGYVVTGYTHPSYLKRWLSNGWRTSNNNQVENQDLWKEIIELNKSRNIEFVLIRGHGKNYDSVHNRFNTIVDKMCTEMRIMYNDHVRQVNKMIPHS